ncbi:MAG: MBL fold metallo-hydrolase [Verrucomicrobiales bacterium]|nr:MBL fold metallo-hydrolase [Verrucomicrobiales bacterium]
MESYLRLVRLCALFAVGSAVPVHAQTPPRFTEALLKTNREVSLRIAGETGRRYRIDVSEDLRAWRALATIAGGPNVAHVDSANPGSTPRFYRAVDTADPAALTGDHLATDAGDAVLHPVNHASLVVGWNGVVVYVDPVGGAAAFSGLPKADLLLVTHSHGDHFHAATLDAMRKDGSVIVAPAAVWATLSAALKAIAVPMANGASTNWAALGGLGVEAVPAYNANHPKGTGNGYVLTLGGRRIYFSGDTEDVAEMRALPNIDAAFLCMNVPFTMTVDRAAGAVRAFRPRFVYPYHYRNQDGTFANLERFRQLVGSEAGVEIRLRKWY